MIKATSQRTDVKGAGLTGLGATIRSVELETGIPAMTLRDWEKRFGFPAPLRRPGSDRRLYSANDISRLRLLKGAMTLGYRIGDVMHKPDDELKAIMGTAFTQGQPLHSPFSFDEVEIESLVSMLAKDDYDGFQSRIQLAASTYGAKRFASEFAHPLMVAVGDAWRKSSISVRHEHFASDCVTTALRQLLSQLQPSGISPVVLLATLPNEVYSLPLLFAGLYLSTLGAKVRMLSGRTPHDEISRAAIAMRVAYVGISVSQESATKETLRDLRRLRRQMPQHIRLWVGGAGAPALQVSPHLAHVLPDWQAMETAVREARRTKGAAQ